MRAASGICLSCAVRGTVRWPGEATSELGTLEDNQGRPGDERGDGRVEVVGIRAEEANDEGVDVNAREEEGG